LRFFIHWKERDNSTDYDLSAVVLGEDLKPLFHLSYTNLRHSVHVHSGDITSAPNGASEFVDLRLDAVDGAYIVPQVYVYRGEGFDEVDESFFGFMARDETQDGLPFEPRTVRTKFELRGSSRVAMPLVFVREGGQWQAKWLNLFVAGRGFGNRVESNRLSTSLLVGAALMHQHLTVAYLANLSDADGESVIHIRRETSDDERNVITLANLRDVIPE
jgi:stress response protein SCP2